MHITVAGKQVETGEALKTHVRRTISARRVRVLVFRPRITHPRGEQGYERGGWVMTGVRHLSATGV